MRPATFSTLWKMPAGDLELDCNSLETFLYSIQTVLKVITFQHQNTSR